MKTKPLLFKKNFQFGKFKLNWQTQDLKYCTLLLHLIVFTFNSLPFLNHLSLAPFLVTLTFSVTVFPSVTSMSVKPSLNLSGKAVGYNTGILHSLSFTNFNALIESNRAMFESKLFPYSIKFCIVFFATINLRWIYCMLSSSGTWPYYKVYKKYIQ